jgi:hypothetical protein
VLGICFDNGRLLWRQRLELSCLDISKRDYANGKQSHECFFVGPNDETARNQIRQFSKASDATYAATPCVQDHLPGCCDDKKFALAISRSAMIASRCLLRSKPAPL